jgi:hypothetical protein
LDLPGEIWKKKWTVRRVVAHLMREEIVEAIGATRENPEFWRAYSKTVSTIISDMEPETFARYEGYMKEWNNLGPPLDIQHK